MDTENIPRIFWHALSFCMVIATVGLLFIAYQSTTISLDTANTKTGLSTARSETKDIKAELQVENERLKKANKLLEEQIAMLERSVSDNGGPTVSAAELARIKALSDTRTSTQPSVIPESRFKELDDRLDMVQQSIQQKAR